MIQSRDIIMFGLQPWDIEIGSNFKNMAVEIARHNRVLYVNRPLDRITYWKKRADPKTQTRLESIRKGIQFIQQISFSHWVMNPAVMLESINWLPAGKIYDLLNRRNNKKLAEQITIAVEQLNFKDPILIIDNDFFNGLYLKEYLHPSCMVYYIRDYLLSQSYFQKHGTVAEPALIAKADLVTANSGYLANYAKKYNANSFYIGQGCEVENFVKNPGIIPAVIKEINRPIIGYCGALISTRLDISLLLSLAKSRPEWSFVLVGPQDEDFKNSELHALSNVYFLGTKNAADLPAYVHHFDVCINPQVINQMTIGNYPRKVDEYLAAGKPVVATATEAMQEFADCCYLCKDVDEYISAITQALKEAGDEQSRAKRVKTAQGHTWEASVNLLYKAIEQTKKSN